MSKYYFQNEDSEFCETKESIIDSMRCDEIKTKEVFKADRVVDSDFMFCNVVDEAGEKGYCSDCVHYVPRNKINGICLHNKPVYEPGEKIIIKIK